MIYVYIYCCSSADQLCPTLFDPIDCSTPGFPVLHYLPEYTKTYVHWVSDAIQPSHPLSPPSPPALNLPPYQGLFQSVSSWHQMAKVLEPQLLHQSFQWLFSWFALGPTGLIFLLSKGLSRVFSSPAVQKDQIFSSQPLWSSSHICTWLLENHSFGLLKDFLWYCINFYTLVDC